MPLQTPRLNATRLAIAVGATLASAGAVALIRRLVSPPESFGAAPLWPRPDGSLPSAALYLSYGLVWDYWEEPGAVDRGSA